jgi:hypothetical protein
MGSTGQEVFNHDVHNEGTKNTIKTTKFQYFVNIVHTLCPLWLNTTPGTAFVPIVVKFNLWYILLNPGYGQPETR